MNLNDLLRQIPVSDLAKKFGVDEREVTEAVKLAAPSLLGGMAINAQSEDGAASLSNALDKHTAPVSSIDEVDVEDGKKIVKKVFGEKEAPMVKALEAEASSSNAGSLISTLLPIIAPLIMQFLSGQKQQTQSSSGGGISDILGGLLGGGSSSTASSSGGLTDILGGILGGGDSNQQSSQGGLGSILGGLFGK